MTTILAGIGWYITHFGIATENMNLANIVAATTGLFGLPGAVYSEIRFRKPESGGAASLSKAADTLAHAVRSQLEQADRVHSLQHGTASLPAARSLADAVGSWQQSHLLVGERAEAGTAGSPEAGSRHLRLRLADRPWRPRHRRDHALHPLPVHQVSIRSIPSHPAPASPLPAPMGPVDSLGTAHPVPAHFQPARALPAHDATTRPFPSHVFPAHKWPGHHLPGHPQTGPAAPSPAQFYGAPSTAGAVSLAGATPVGLPEPRLSGHLHPGSAQPCPSVLYTVQPQPTRGGEARRVLALASAVVAVGASGVLVGTALTGRPGTEMAAATRPPGMASAPVQPAMAETRYSNELAPAVNHSSAPAAPPPPMPDMAPASAVTAHHPRAETAWGHPENPQGGGIGGPETAAEDDEDAVGESASTADCAAATERPEGRRQDEAHSDLGTVRHRKPDRPGGHGVPGGGLGVPDSREDAEACEDRAGEDEGDADDETRERAAQPSDNGHDSDHEDDRDDEDDREDRDDD